VYELEGCSGLAGPCIFQHKTQTSSSFHYKTKTNLFEFSSTNISPAKEKPSSATKGKSWSINTMRKSSPSRNARIGPPTNPGVSMARLQEKEEIHFGRRTAVGCRRHQPLTSPCSNDARRAMKGRQLHLPAPRSVKLLETTPHITTYAALAPMIVIYDIIGRFRSYGTISSTPAKEIPVLNQPPQGPRERISHGCILHAQGRLQYSAMIVHLSPLFRQHARKPLAK
jgi:hypothetical protein